MARRTIRRGSASPPAPRASDSAQGRPSPSDGARTRGASGSVAPDARQEQRAALARGENQAVAVGLERSSQVRIRFPPGSAAGGRGSRRRGEAPPVRTSLSGGKRGSAKAACTVLASASSISGRRGLSEPMQPRSRSFSVRVTKVARQGESAGDASSRLGAGDLPPFCAARRERGHAGRKQALAIGSRQAAPRPHIRTRRRRSRRRARRPRQRPPMSPDAGRSPACRARRRSRARP